MLGGLGADGQQQVRRKVQVLTLRVGSVTEGAFLTQRPHACLPFSHDLLTLMPIALVQVNLDS